MIVHNIYNLARRSESDSTILVDVCTILHDNQFSEQILLGDFNLHHPMWGGTDVRHIDPESADLLAIIEDFNLGSTLPPGTITYEERTSRGRRQSGQGSHRMERRRPQKLAGRRASPAVHYKVDCEKMVQHTSRTGMDSKVAQGY